jgi:hypothetical protein
LQLVRTTYFGIQAVKLRGSTAGAEYLEKMKVGHSVFRVYGSP